MCVCVFITGTREEPGTLTRLFSLVLVPLVWESTQNSRVALSTKLQPPGGTIVTAPSVCVLFEFEFTVFLGCTVFLGKVFISYRQHQLRCSFPVGYDDKGHEPMRYYYPRETLYEIYKRESLRDYCGHLIRNICHASKTTNFSKRDTFIFCPSKRASKQLDWHKRNTLEHINKT